MQEQIIAPYRIDPAWLISAASFLVDRVILDCERIHLPAQEVHGGVLSYGRGACMTRSKPRMQVFSTCARTRPPTGRFS